MLSTPPGIGQPTREAGTGREDRGQRGNKRYDRARGSPDRHATYIVAAYLASAARYPAGTETLPPDGHGCQAAANRPQSPTATSNRSANRSSAWPWAIVARR
jgi:hypothetical protein